MAVICLVRVDNRLIHGQVATGWISKCSATKIVVIDDRSAENEMMRDVLELATPPGIQLEVFSVAQAAEAWNRDRFGPSGAVMVIFKSIPAAFEAWNSGFHFEELQIGGTASGADRKVLEGAISLNAAEFRLLQQLNAEGVAITLQQTVQTRITPWRDAAKRLKF